MTRKQKTTKEKLSSEIVDYLRQRGMTLKQIGENIACSESFVSRVGKGERSLTIEHLMLLEKNLGAPLPLLLLEASHRGSVDNRIRSSYEDLRQLRENSAKTRALLLCEEVDCPLTVNIMGRGTKTPSRTSKQKVFVVCSNKTRLNELVDVVSQRCADVFTVKSFTKTSDLNGALTHNVKNVRLIVLSLVGGKADPPWDLWLLRHKSYAPIIVEIEKGGRALIRIADNGAGMSRDDALLSIERYATSKLKTDEDLFAIRTLGLEVKPCPASRRFPGSG